MPLDVRRAAIEHRGHVREDAGLAAHRVVLGPRQRHVFIRAGVRRPLQLHGKQLARTSHRIDAKKKEGVDREDDGDESEAECDRGDDGHSGQRCTTERAKRIDDVACQVVDDRGAARVAALVGGQGDRTETRDRPGASLDGTQTGGDLLLGLARDVERELLVELAFDAVGHDQCANPQEEVAEVHLVSPKLCEGGAVTPASSPGRWPWTCAPTRRPPPPAAGVRRA